MWIIISKEQKTSHGWRSDHWGFPLSQVILGLSQESPTSLGFPRG